MLLPSQDVRNVCEPANDNNILFCIVPRQPAWVFEVDGEIFFNLTAAETFSKSTGKPIYCRTSSQRKAKP